MISIPLLFIILIVHWVADFILQRHIDAVNKSTSIRHLVNHTGTYSVCWFPILLLLTGNVATSLLFTIITFILHTITDYFTSKQVKKLFDKNDYHNGFVVIGFDQILHYTQLILTFILLV